MTWVFSCLEYDSFSLDLCVHEFDNVYKSRRI